MAVVLLSHYDTNGSTVEAVRRFLDDDPRRSRRSISGATVLGSSASSDSSPEESSKKSVVLWPKSAWLAIDSMPCNCGWTDLTGLISACVTCGDLRDELDIRIVSLSSSACKNVAILLPRKCDDVVFGLHCCRYVYWFTLTTAAR